LPQCGLWLFLKEVDSTNGDETWSFDPTGRTKVQAAMSDVRQRMTGIR